MKLKVNSDRELPQNPTATDNSLNVANCRCSFQVSSQSPIEIGKLAQNLVKGYC